MIVLCHRSSAPSLAFACFVVLFKYGTSWFCVSRVSSFFEAYSKFTSEQSRNRARRYVVSLLLPRPLCLWVYLELRILRPSSSTSDVFWLQSMTSLRVPKWRPFRRSFELAWNISVSRLSFTKPASSQKTMSLNIWWRFVALVV